MDNILYIVSYIIIAIGLIISVVGLPGIWAVTGGILLWSLIDGFSRISIFWIIFFIILSVASTLVDNFVVLLGAKKYGASKYGMLGAFIGLIFGFMIGNIVGMIVGMFLGATLTEIIIMKKETNSAIKIGWGTLVGYIFSIIVKFFLAVLIIIVWRFVIL